MNVQTPAPPEALRVVPATPETEDPAAAAAPQRDARAAHALCEDALSDSAATLDLKASAGRLVGALRRLARAEALRARFKVRESVWSGALVAWLAIAGVAATATAGVLLVSGLADGFAAWFGGRAWAGNLAAAALIFGGGFGVWAWKRRADLRAMAAKAGLDEPSARDG
ncbi:MAG TPA: hypothetical protein VEI02_05660, partial [Planctomycetota bacterium]|nr:hypothetical protein [Planctomycetota bacterium]